MVLMYTAISGLEAFWFFVGKFSYGIALTCLCVGLWWLYGEVKERL